MDEIKIDRSFVKDLGRDANDATIVRAVIDLGRNLGLRVIAEGVETEEIWNELTTLGCNLAQGYFVSPPVSETMLSLWLSQWSSHVNRLPAPQSGRPKLRLAR